jgi:hypothetical protein
MTSERSKTAEDYGDISITNGFPEPDPPPPDPIETAHAHAIRSRVNDRSRTALHEKYSALLEQQTRLRLKLIDEAIAAKNAAVDREVAAKKAAAERELAMLDECAKRRREEFDLLSATLAAVETSTVESAMRALNDKAQFYQLIRAPKKEAPTGGELAVDSFKYVIDSVRDVVKGNPILLAPVARFFENLASSTEGAAQTAAVDITKMPLGELYERGRALPSEMRGGREPEEMPMKELVELLVKVHAPTA